MDKRKSIPTPGSSRTVQRSSSRNNSKRDPEVLDVDSSTDEDETTELISTLLTRLETLETTQTATTLLFQEHLQKQRHEINLLKQFLRDEEARIRRKRDRVQRLKLKRLKAISISQKWGGGGGGGGKRVVVRESPDEISPSSQLRVENDMRMGKEDDDGDGGSGENESSDGDPMPGVIDARGKFARHDSSSRAPPPPKTGAGATSANPRSGSVVDMTMDVDIDMEDATVDNQDDDEPVISDIMEDTGAAAAVEPEPPSFVKKIAQSKLGKLKAISVSTKQSETSGKLASGKEVQYKAPVQKMRPSRVLSKDSGASGTETQQKAPVRKLRPSREIGKDSGASGTETQQKATVQKMRPSREIGKESAEGSSGMESQRPKMRPSRDIGQSKAVDQAGESDASSNNSRNISSGSEEVRKPGGIKAVGLGKLRRSLGKSTSSSSGSRSGEDRSAASSTKGAIRVGGPSFNAINKPSSKPDPTPPKAAAAAVSSPPQATPEAPLFLGGPDDIVSSPEMSQNKSQRYPDNPAYFSAEVLRTAFGGGKVGATIAKISQEGLKNQLIDCEYYICLSPEMHDNSPRSMGENGSMLEVAGVDDPFDIDPSQTYPLFMKSGKIYLYCGEYKLGARAKLPLGEWKALSEEAKSHWIKKIHTTVWGQNLLRAGGFLGGGGLLNATAFEVQGWFERADNENALRLTSTSLEFVRFNRKTYDTLLQTHREATDSPPPTRDSLLRQHQQLQQQRKRTAPDTSAKGTPLPPRRRRSITPIQSSRKRLRVEDQPADFSDSDPGIPPAPSQVARKKIRRSEPAIIPNSAKRRATEGVDYNKSLWPSIGDDNDPEGEEDIGGDEGDVVAEGSTSRRNKNKPRRHSTTTTAAAAVVQPVIHDLCTDDDDEYVNEEEEET